ncbi:TlpA family protein disulfide reductase [Bacillus sp. ISL-35]|uniref:peroxiredoxin family protein n=1 Tax=Bacillus sp. ISL-35 TaxID=2819122 RepID=UPI001BE5935F|nr:TlpA disulfide reductase family protein [Bacillus sp. ISL-35]MBT2680860.1 TlpA family protein disulfide reductase [Bacillus sp. ISL-35]MBT2705176.1 TlpA family protein disulfide reductase [Chryseobacterium sp. ISL-80]
MIKKAIGAGILAGLLLFAVFQHFYKADDPAAIQASTTSAGIDIGLMAPSFTLKNFAGEEIDLKKYKGRKIMLNFWATWCPPCKEEMPAMEKFYKNHSGQIEILAINLDPQNDVKGFAEKNDLSFQILLDESGTTQKSYQIISIPTTFIIDEKGVILKRHIGSMSYEQMEELLK